MKTKEPFVQKLVHKAAQGIVRRERYGWPPDRFALRHGCRLLSTTGQGMRQGGPALYLPYYNILPNSLIQTE